MTFYSAKHERERRERETPARILNIARARGQFDVSLRYRDDWLRKRCHQLRAQGLLTGGRRNGDRLVFYPATIADRTNNTPAITRLGKGGDTP